jgi:hypothetical protein
MSASTPSELSQPACWRVHVLCAQWCGTCRDYRAFADAQALQGAQDWVWVDVETHADLLGDLDVENFPTLLVTEGDEPRFLGTVTPQPEVALRLIQSLQAGNRYAVPDAAGLADIARALRAL